MDIKEKITTALMDNLEVHYVRLEDDDGITGFVVSPRFRDMPTLDRQDLIDNALSTSEKSLTPQEQRQVLMIAGVTPEEYESVGAHIRVHNIEEMAGGTVEVLLHGGHSDAEYVRGALSNQKDVETTEPKSVPGAIGVSMSFQAKGDAANPLTKARVIEILKGDRYIDVMANA